MSTTTTYHKVTFFLPNEQEDDQEREIELCIIPRMGETVVLDDSPYVVTRVLNDIRKRSGIFGKMGMYINRIRVTLEDV